MGMQARWLKMISKLPPNTNRNEMVDLMDGLIEETNVATETYLERVGGENQDTRGYG